MKRCETCGATQTILVGDIVRIYGNPLECHTRKIVEIDKTRIKEIRLDHSINGLYWWDSKEIHIIL